MKYASYSPLTGTIIYLVNVAVFLLVNWFLISRVDKPKTKKLMKWLETGQILSIIGDAYFWYTSSVLVPIAFPYDKHGEQFTIFDISLMLFLTANILIAELMASLSESDHNDHNDTD